MYAPITRRSLICLFVQMCDFSISKKKIAIIKIAIIEGRVCHLFQFFDKIFVNFRRIWPIFEVIF